MSPWVGLSNPVTKLNNVVLPAPLGPITLTVSPSFTSKLTRSTASTPSKLRERFLISSKAIVEAYCVFRIALGTE